VPRNKSVVLCAPLKLCSGTNLISLAKLRHKHVWTVATHKEDVSFEEMKRRAAKKFSNA
jgi:hypothetical protein